MSEPYSKMYLSCDLGQGLAVRDGVTFIFDGTAVNKATNAEINVFFDSAMDLEALQPEMFNAMDENSLSDLVKTATVKADALRFLLFGMDHSLSDGLRLTSIKRASTLLAQPEAAAYTRKRFLKIADSDDWDGRSAAVFATMVGADMPALLYLAATVPEKLEALQLLDSEQWPTSEARSQVEQSLTSDRRSAGRAVWNLAAECLGDLPMHQKTALPEARWFIDRFRDVGIPEVRGQVARAMVYYATIEYRETGEAKASLQSLEDVEAYVRASGLPQLAPLEAMAMICRAEIAAQQGESAEALGINEAAIKLIATRSDPFSRNWCAMARYACGRLIAGLGQWQAAIEQYDKLIVGFKPRESLRIRILVAKARYSKANALLQHDRHRLAIAELQSLLDKLNPENIEELQVLQAEAEYNLGWLHTQTGNIPAAIIFYRRAAATCDQISGSDAAEVHAEALYNLGILFGQVGDHGQAVTTYSSVVSNIGETDDYDRQLLAVQALFNLGLSLEKIGRFADATVVFDAVLARTPRLGRALALAGKAASKRAQLSEFIRGKHGEIAMAASSKEPLDFILSDSEESEL